MTDDEIRAIIVSDRDRIQRLMLTEQEYEVLRHFINYTDFTSSQVTAVFRFRTSHTSMVMLRLYEKGYVTRRRVKSHSGGSEYKFRARQ